MTLVEVFTSQGYYLQTLPRVTPTDTNKLSTQKT